jgi:hypothetical protein
VSLIAIEYGKTMSGDHDKDLEGYANNMVAGLLFVAR